MKQTQMERIEENQQDRKESANLQAKIVYALLLVPVVLLGLMWYWLVFPAQVLEIKKLPIPVTKPENIKSGRILSLMFDYCKHIDAQGTVEATLVSDKSVIMLPTYTERLPQGCSKVTAPMILPYTIIEQDYHIHYKVTYKVNPIREVVEEFDSQEFTLNPIDLPIDQHLTN